MNVVNPRFLSLTGTLMLLITSCNAIGAPGNRESDSLPHQYIYLADFSKLRHEAELGNPDALFQLGVMYYDPPPGSGIAQSYHRAFLMFFEAALRGHTTAQHNVGAMYWNGDYVNQNIVEGYAWFRLAALGGDAAGRRKQKLHQSDLSATELEASLLRLSQLQQLQTKANKEHNYSPHDHGIN